MVLDKVVQCLEENGILVLDTGELDEYDSIELVSALVELEAQFDIEFPDELLQMHTFSRIEVIVKIIESLLESKNHKEID